MSSKVDVMYLEKCSKYEDMPTSTALIVTYVVKVSRGRRFRKLLWKR